ncbi:MAG: PSD1 and planctomycete cytochrome C domain-containing protein, partial [Vicinamibacterales bacterium]|nr:PSD1 and planctomycete cytochrome C domain-containing protein [Vicinamibacterales bacterium]
MSVRHCLIGVILALSVSTSLFAQTTDVEFFEAKIRPVLVQRCYACHNSKMAAPKGELTLDTREGLLKGGVSGPAIVPGRPADSRLMKVLSYSDSMVQMPPAGKLPDAMLADFAQWISAGAVDPRVTAPALASASPQYKGMSLEEGRTWWAFQPVAAHGESKIDGFVLARLQEKSLKPSPQADKRTLVTRAYVDLLGYKPTFEEVQAFVNDRTPNAWATLIDRLQASPHYGERWGRHWMDVARYAEDNPSSEATNPPYPFAWRYRDWIIEALNADVPYDRFIKLQLAADLMPSAKRDDMRALGYVGAAPIYHHDLRLSGDVIGTFLTDDWDERIDAVSRGVLGISMGCARCHDHKFDPITQKDYYALMGVFASTVRAERPTFAVDPKAEQEFMWLQRELFDLAYSINLLGNEGTTFTGGAEKSVTWKAQMEALKQRATTNLAKYPQLLQSLDKYWNPPRRAPAPAAAAAAVPAPAAAATPVIPPTRAPNGGRAAGAGGRGRGAGPGAAGTVAAAPVPPAAAAAAAGRGRAGGSNDPYMNAVFEAAQYVDASDPSYTFIQYKPGEVRDMPVLRAGNVAAPGEIVPRGFPAVLARGDDRNFKQGSGRLELADRIFTDAPGLAARVIVNRVWGWHFGKGLVATASDFGTQGDKPTHPELLDDLAARFIAHGWSLKWLNKEIMLSAVYQQSSNPRPDGLQADEANALLWRQNPRRLDAEAYRDTLVRSAGVLDLAMGGLPGDVDLDTYYRRSIYGRVSRARSAQVLALFDFPEATQTAPGRDVTTSTLQQI